MCCRRDLGETVYSSSPRGDSCLSSLELDWVARVPYPIQIWRFGERIDLLALGGEVCVDYALRLKKELGPERVWPVAYANEVPCYIPSDLDYPCYLQSEGTYPQCCRQNRVDGFQPVPKRFHPP